MKSNNEKIGRATNVKIKGCSNSVHVNGSPGSYMALNKGNVNKAYVFACAFLHRYLCVSTSNNRNSRSNV